MPDPRFYRRAGPFRLADLAGRAGARLAKGANPDLLISDIGDIDTAGHGEIVYFADPAHTIALSTSRYGACVTTEKLAAKVQGGAAMIAADPRAAFAAIAHVFYPPLSPAAFGQESKISGHAAIAADAVIAPGAVIGPNASIGARSVIGANAVIGAGAVIGDDCRIGANATMTYCLVGNRVVVHPGVQVGQDGFGFVSGAAGHEKVPQLGRVVIQDDVEIGAGTCIDRGTMGDTVIGAGTKIDNLVQIAHNVEIGQHCIIVSQAGISGSCKIGNGVVMGGQVGIADHVRVGDGAQIAGKSGVMRDIGPGEAVMGYPAKPIRHFWREIAALSRLTKRDK
jgi:UDP-3-O-[3-hydroxymyristoyl] glucosamine N-acyltransferase